MITTQPSIRRIALSFGILLALLTIALQVISFVFDAHIERPWWVSLLQFAISISVLTYGIKTFKTNNSGFLTLGQAIKTGLAISLIAGIISVIFNYFFITYIDPTFVQKTLELTRQQLEMNPNLTPEQVDMSMEMSSKSMTPLIMSAFAILLTLFFGFIISLVAGLIMRRNPPQTL